MAKKIEMLNDQQEVVHPLTSSDCVIMENGKTLEEVMGDGIATPTVTHEGASFQVGVGDSNIEVVDGDVAGMTLEGQTYQNILPKPTTLIMETDEKEFKINDKIDNNIVLDDNVAEIATIKGQTYVNAVQEESASEYVAIDEELNGQSITTTGKPEGYVKNATLEGLTLVNAIQEPSEANATVLELDADIDAQYATIDNTVQGGIHGAILKGQTLVNLSENLQTITYTLSEWYHNVKLMNNIEKLKRNTYYTVLYRLENLSGNHEHYNGIGLGIGMNTFNKDLPGIAGALDKNGGWCKIRFQLTDDFIEQNPTYKQLHIRPIRRGIAPVEGESVDYTIRGFAILEGDYITNPIPFNKVFEGMQSVKMPVLTTTGKNLFDGEIEFGTLSTDTGKKVASSDYIRSVNFIPIGENKRLTISNNMGYTWYFYAYDSNFNFIERFSINSNIPENCKYIKFRSGVGGQNSLEVEIQIEEGTIATPYEPYKSNILSCELVPMNQSMFEQGTFSESTPPNTRTYEGIKVNSGNLYDTRIRTKGTYKVVQGATYEVQLNDGYGIFVCFCKNGLYSAKINRWLDGARTTFTVPNDCDEMFFALRKTDNSAITPSDYSRIGLKIHQEVVLRSLSNGVCDTLNLNTGEYVQRVGEVVLNGSEAWLIDLQRETYIRYKINLPHKTKNQSFTISDKLQTITNDNAITDSVRTANNSNTLWIYKINSTGLDEFKTWLSQNPVTIQYELETESIKTVDLSIVDQDNNSVKSIQTHPTLTHVSTSSQGLIPNIVIPSQLKYPTIIKPSTTYTVQLKQTTVNSDNPLTINLGGTTMAVPSTKFTITTPETLTSQDVIFTGKNNVIGEVVITEGDTTGIDYRFFEGMNDVKSPSMYATGKNLLDEKNTQLYSKESKKIIVTKNTATSATKLQTIKLEKGDYTLSVSNIIYDGTTPIEFGFYDFNNSKWKFNSALKIIMNRHYTTFSVTETGFYDFALFKHGAGVLNEFETNIQIEKGSTATSYEPYKGVTIEQSIDSIPLTSSMFSNGYYDYDKIIKGMSIQQIPLATNSHYIERRIYSKSLIKVKPNSKYKVVGGLYGWFLFFDKNGNNIMKRAGSLDGVITNEFTTDSNTYYVGMVLHKQDNGVVITLSDIPSDLTLQEVTNEIVLRSIGDIKDTLNLTTGEYVQRIGEIVLDSSENWSIEESKNGFNRFYTENLPSSKYNIDGGLICDKYNTIDRLQYVNPTKEGFALCTSFLGVVTPLSLQDFKTYLNLNLITVQYELKTPIIKKVNLTNTTKLPSYASTTHYDTIVPSNSLVPNIKIPSTIDYNVAIKPSTQYTIRANTTSAMSVNLGGSTGTLANGKVTLTTPSTLAHNSLKLGSSGKAKEVMVIEGNEIKDNVPFFNGMKNVQMGGIKLVNIARFKDVAGNVTANANKTQFTFTDDGSSWGYVNFDGSLLKPNTQYTVYMNIITNTGGHDKPIKFECGSHNDTQNYCDVSKGFVGIYKQTITLNENISKNKFSLVFRAYASGGQVIVKNPMIIEGDWTHLDEIPFIESEMIIEQPIIRSQGKNLFDINSDKELSCFYSATQNGKLTSHTGVDTYTIKIKPNTSYTLSCVGESMSHITYWDNSMSYIGAEVDYADTSLRYITTPIKASYLKIPIHKQGVTNIQIEEGSSATTYEPFKQHTLSSNRVIGYEEGCYYGYMSGNRNTYDTYNSILADVEGLSIAYVTNGSSNYSFWDKDMVYISGKGFLDTSLNKDDKNGFIQIPSNAKYMRFASANNDITRVDYTKASVTGELPLRSLPNGVCDSFNLVTGEYVQRIGEVVLHGSSDEKWARNNDNDDSSCFYAWKLKDCGYKLNGEVSCDYLKELEPYSFWSKSNVGFFSKNGNGAFYLVVTKDMLTAYNNSIQNYLSQNPITVQYELATPIVRKIGLTAKGNYKEITLDGSENWGNYTRATGLINTVGYLTSISDSLNLGETEIYNVFAEEPFSNIASLYSTDAEGCNFKLGNLRVSVKKSRLDEVSSTGFKRYVSLNPFKIGYISTAQSATSYSNILKPIFFNNVDIQFMNNNIDIQPSLTLQARSRNSYVMDMMKANTRYTLKALKNSNSFTIDGTSYGAGTNGTFTSPSTLTNKLMITGQDVQELMIIEGDVTGLTIPYYKGIRSAYDNVDEIEIYSVGKNLFDMNKLTYSTKNVNVTYRDVNKIIFNTSETWAGLAYDMQLKPNTKYILSCIKNKTSIKQFYRLYNGSSYSSSGEGGGSTVTFTTNNTGKVRFTYEDSIGNTTDNEVSNIMLEEASTATPYQQHQHNTTSLPMPMQLETVEVVKLDRVKDMEIGAINHSTGANTNSSTVIRTKNYIPVQPNMQITYCNNGVERATHFIYYDINKNFIGGRIYESGVTSKGTVTTPDNCYFIRLYHGVTNVDNLTITKQQYKPIALNELPNGVKDELIINRATSSAKLIRRVGKVLVDGNESGWTVNVQSCSTANTRFVVSIKGLLPNIKANNAYVIADEMNVYNYNDSTKYPTLEEKIVKTTNEFYLYTSKADSISTLKQYLQQNPITVYYELAEPVVTEISLKGYPFVYKDGLVQLNTEIPHTTKVKYNVNQEHLINGQNETIIRHDKQIDNLYDYIELYLEEEYRMELFRMQLELSL